MYIEFKILDNDIHYGIIVIHHVMNKWAEKYNTSFKLKPVKKTVRAFLELPEYYSIFALTWSDFASSSSITNSWRLVEPMKSPNQLT